MKKRRSAASPSALNAPPASLNTRESVDLEMRSLSVGSSPGAAGGASSFSSTRMTGEDFPLEAEEPEDDYGVGALENLLPQNVRLEATLLSLQYLL
jgi:hypothetical protein